VKFAFIDAEKANYPVDFMCRQLGVSRSGFYAARRREPSARKRDEARLVEEVKAVHAGSRGTYGSPRVHATLKAQGRATSRKRVARVMREHDLVARSRRRFRRTTDSRHTFPVAENVLGRAFTTTAPNEVWVTDITYVWTREGWLYVAAILDLYSRMVVGWAMSERIDRRLCLSALRMAVEARRPTPGLVHHSDRGSQYASTEYRRALEEHEMVCSMSRRGDCWDNAVAESFWSTLKAELVDGTDFPTRAAARQAVFEFIEVFYNRSRIHSHLGYRTPAEHESLYMSARAAA
jgi:transposase InsO family protein